MSDASRGTATVRINLTPEQAALAEAATARDAEAIELPVEELEQRIAAILFTSAPLVPRNQAIAANSSESMFVG